MSRATMLSSRHRENEVRHNRTAYPFCHTVETSYKPLSLERDTNIHPAGLDWSERQIGGSEPAMVVRVRNPAVSMMTGR